MNKRCWKLTVYGGGKFPMDMLRYDACHPRGPDDVSKIEATFDRATRVPVSEMPLRQNHIHLVSHANRPTPDRWRSFGWGCEVEEVR